MRAAMGFLIALVFGLGNCASGKMSADGPYRGQVLDADTRKPLSGVLVVVIWERGVYSPRTKATTDELLAVETHSDAEGRFEVSGDPGTHLEPFVTDVRPKGIIFFAPEYVQEGIDVKPGTKRFRDPTRIYMKRVKNAADALDLGLAPSFPYDRTPLLLETLNQERARLGLPLIQSGKQ